MLNRLIQGIYVIYIPRAKVSGWICTLCDSHADGEFDDLLESLDDPAVAAKRRVLVSVREEREVLAGASHVGRHEADGGHKGKEQVVKDFVHSMRSRGHFSTVPNHY